ncbi:MAG: SpoIID/LytB domain-containing protein [Microgenomates group bacterium]
MLNSKLKFIFTFVFVFIGTLYLVLGTARAVSESDCLNKSVSELSQGDMDVCINEILPRIAAAYAPAQEKNKANLANLKKQIDTLNFRINSISKELTSKENNIKSREKDVAYAQEILNQKAVSQYITARLYDPLVSFISASDAIEAFKTIKIKEMVADDDRKTIQKYSEEIIKLKNDKESLEKNKSSLASLQKKVSEDAKFLEGEVGKVESFLTALSSKQQEIINAKSGAFTASVGDSDLADDINASIKGFRDNAPAGSFAVFSFGGYTHRKGMSQYGARGRAQNGQNASQILKAYYGKEPVSKDTGGTIFVAGLGNINFEDYYLWGIAEMPSSWHPEALKAQAIAARTYAYRYKVEGKQICTTEACQVFRKSKADSPPDAWKQAVQATRGQIIEGVTTFYSSTAGGYSTTSGWDTTDGSGGANFIDKAYEKLGGSPWLYKAWYRQGYTSSGATCGQSDPWLNNEEFTDIVNAALVLRGGNDSRVSSTSTGCWGGNPYSYSELKEKGGVSSVSSVSVSQGNGVTTNVNINGNINLTGDEFKQAFNLRAPGYLMVPQKGFAFFNIEKK